MSEQEAEYVPVTTNTTGEFTWGYDVMGWREKARQLSALRAAILALAEVMDGQAPPQMVLRGIAGGE